MIESTHSKLNQYLPFWKHLRLSYTNVVYMHTYIIFCCLISRDEERGADEPADADKNLILR